MRIRSLGTALALIASTLPVLDASCADYATRSTPSTALVSAGWSFGFCLGPCQGELALQGVALDYEVRDRTGETVYARNRGQLTGAAASRLRELEAALPPGLPATFGCPDCADAGLAFVTLSTDGASRRTDYEYPSPPPELAALDAFLKDVMDALARCAATGDVVPSPGCTVIPR